MDKKDLKIALVHDFLTQWGGAEKVLEALTEMFPAAPIYTLLYDAEEMRGKFKDREIHTSFLQSFPKFLRKTKMRRFLLPFIPTAPETFDLRDFDLVISSSGAWSKGIVTKLNTIHIAYLHSPMRYAWDYNGKYTREIRKNWLNFLVRPLLNYVRVWDRQAADRPDYLVANSKYTQERIKKYYRRDSVVIYPPAVQLATHNSQLTTKNSGGQNAKVMSYKLPVADYFLVVSRLSPYKKVDIVVEAFNKLGLPLVIVGGGEQEKSLKKIAGKNIKIMGWQSEEVVDQCYSGARAFIFPAEDDFGITMVEAMSHGVPVVAFRKGGSMEIVKEGIMGEFFDAQTPEVLADGVRRFIKNEGKYDKKAIKERAQDFSKEKFREKLTEFISRAE